MTPTVIDLDNFSSGNRGGVVSIGNFDGVHRGHASIARRVAGLASEMHLPGVVMTFDPHPAALLRPDRVPPQLAWLERRCELLGQCGINIVVVCRTNDALLRLSPADFFEQIVVERLAAQALVEGQDFRFGRGRQGTTETLEALAAARGISVEIVEPAIYEGTPISSSRIRAALASGNVEDAAAMLGRPHRIRGKVASGAGRGHEIGFPSANLVQVEAALPANGVYAGVAHQADRTWATAVNVGPNPTFGETSQKVEAHLIDFKGDLYGTRIEVDFRARLRDVRSFGNVDELKAQIQQDVNRARELAAPALADARG